MVAALVSRGWLAYLWSGWRVRAPAGPRLGAEGNGRHGKYGIVQPQRRRRAVTGMCPSERLAAKKERHGRSGAAVAAGAARDGAARRGTAGRGGVRASVRSHGSALQA